MTKKQKQISRSDKNKILTDARELKGIIPKPDKPVSITDMNKAILE